MNIAFVTRDWALRSPYGAPVPTLGGAGYYRCGLITDTLNERSDRHHAAVFPDAAPRHTGELVPLDHRGRPDDTGWDVIVLQRWMRAEMADIITAARQAGQTVINDVDDHFWALHRANNAARSQHTWWNSDHYRRALTASSHVTVSTTYLADVIVDLGVKPDAVTVMPNMIDLRRWTRQPLRHDVRTVGWVGATDYRSADLEQVGDAIRWFTKAHHLTFVHGGHATDAPAARKQLRLTSDTPVDLRRRQPIDRYPALWTGIDIAVLPLNAIPFNRAKSPIKAMEASASGVPFVASDWGPYSEWGRQSAAPLATNPAEWRSHLETMLDPDLRRNHQDAAHALVCTEDVAARWTDWDTFYACVSV